MSQIMIEGRQIGLNQPPFVIAELSANHNGSLDLALETISAAKACGADAVKFQTYTPDTMTLDLDSDEFVVKGGLWNGYKLYDLYKWAHTPFEWHKALFEHARKIGITAFSTPFDESAVDLLESLNAPAYKIASFELLDIPLIRYVANTGKPMIISTGNANENEIEEAVDAAREAGCKELVLLHCISSYPTPVEQSNLRRITAISHRFGVTTGLSDHTFGTTAAVASVALGAAVIEKHFILRRSDGGPDSAFSLEPEEFSQLCSNVKDTSRALGVGRFERQPAEEANLAFRRSIYFTRDLEAGKIITEEDIKRIRPGYGLAPKYFEELIGRRLCVAVKKGMATQWRYFSTEGNLT